MRRVSIDVARRQAPTAFTITAGTRGALENVPVAATYQPNWWFKIELHLDEDVDVPNDPSGDPTLWARINDICTHAPAVTTRSGPPGVFSQRPAFFRQFRQNRQEVGPF